jgi:phage shock protein A
MDHGSNGYPETDEAVSPALEAMKVAMQAAEEAAAARRAAKKREQADAPEAYETLAELALIAEPLELDSRPFISYALGDSPELESLIAEAAAVVPDGADDERDGDLVVLKPVSTVKPWYEEAAEAALHANFQSVAGPIDVKSLLQALMVEIGDVKRTNALLLELITRLDEKVERVSRQLKERRPG